ncbi:putative rab GTPase activator [Plasmodium gaboni]|uniref:Putative rab GTPase activator n=1 Tax=Plasmodium gaboni TaxID=647221 RepID=A0A151LBC6_9APIC|nr:putative rab GTPase activator [Plasmodium gaboni]KYN96265.1 putative rab GTPase activator [Plasmodium gaboni]
MKKIYRQTKTDEIFQSQKNKYHHLINKNHIYNNIYLNLDVYEKWRNLTIDKDENKHWNEKSLNMVLNADANLMDKEVKNLLRRGISDSLKHLIWLRSNDVNYFVINFPHFYETTIYNTFGEKVPTNLSNDCPTFCGGILGLQEDIMCVQTKIEELEIENNDNCGHFNINDSTSNILQLLFNHPNDNEKNSDKYLLPEHNFWLEPKTLSTPNFAFSNKKKKKKFLYIENVKNKFLKSKKIDQYLRVASDSVLPYSNNFILKNISNKFSKYKSNKNIDKKGLFGNIHTNINIFNNNNSNMENYDEKKKEENNSTNNQVNKENTIKLSNCSESEKNILIKDDIIIFHNTNEDNVNDNEEEDDDDEEEEEEEEDEDANVNGNNNGENDIDNKMNTYYHNHPQHDIQISNTNNINNIHNSSIYNNNFERDSCIFTNNYDMPDSNKYLHIQYYMNEQYIISKKQAEKMNKAKLYLRSKRKKKMHKPRDNLRTKSCQESNTSIGAHGSDSSLSNYSNEKTLNDDMESFTLNKGSSYNRTKSFFKKAFGTKYTQPKKNERKLSDHISLLLKKTLNVENCENDDILPNKYLGDSLDERYKNAKRNFAQENDETHGEDNDELTDEEEDELGNEQGGNNSQRKKKNKNKNYTEYKELNENEIKGNNKNIIRNMQYGYHKYNMEYNGKMFVEGYEKDDNNIVKLSEYNSKEIEKNDFGSVDYNEKEIHNLKGEEKTYRKSILGMIKHIFYKKKKENDEDSLDKDIMNKKYINTLERTGEQKSNDFTYNMKNNYINDNTNSKSWTKHDIDKKNGYKKYNMHINNKQKIKRENEIDAFGDTLDDCKCDLNEEEKDINGKKYDTNKNTTNDIKMDSNNNNMNNNNNNDNNNDNNDNNTNNNRGHAYSIIINNENNTNIDYYDIVNGTYNKSKTKHNNYDKSNNTYHNNYNSGQILKYKKNNNDEYNVDNYYRTLERLRHYSCNVQRNREYEGEIMQRNASDNIYKKSYLYVENNNDDFRNQKKNKVFEYEQKGKHMDKENNDNEKDNLLDTHDSFISDYENGMDNLKLPSSHELNDDDIKKKGEKKKKKINFQDAYEEKGEENDLSNNKKSDKIYYYDKDEKSGDNNNNNKENIVDFRIKESSGGEDVKNDMNNLNEKETNNNMKKYGLPLNNKENKHLEQELYNKFYENKNPNNAYPNVYNLDDATELTALLNDDGKHEIRKLLWAINNNFGNDVEFAPIIPNLCIVLLIYFKASVVYCIIHCLIKKGIDSVRNKQLPFFIYKRKDFVKYVKYILNAFIQFLPKCYHYLRKLNFDLAAWTARCIQDGFSRMLPFDFVLRIYGIYLFEGQKTLCLYCLALLKFLENDILKCTNIEEVENILYHICMHPYLDINELTQIAYRFKLKSKEKHLKFSTKCPSPYLMNVKLKTFYRPRLNDNSTLINSFHWENIWEKIPSNIRSLDPFLTYATKKDGYNLQILLEKTERNKKKPMILILKTFDCDLIGFFCPFSLNRDYNFVSTSDKSSAFVFTFNSNFNFYKWSGKNNTSVLIKDGIYIGGNDIAIYIDKDIKVGKTNPSDSFLSPPLITGGNDFNIMDIEIWNLK